MGPAIFELSLLEMTVGKIEEAARFYGESGFLVLRDAGGLLVSMFENVLAAVLAAEGISLDEVKRGTVSFAAFSPSTRKKVSQIPSTPRLAHRLLSTLEPFLERVLGPIVHVSRDFHAHFKGSVFPQTVTGYGGYPTGTEYLEPFSQFLLHQDFTGANLPTSPSFPTLWVPLTTGDNWGLRLYPGSHRRGLLCNRFIEFDHPRLELLGKPLDLPPARGKLLFFHGLLVHGTTNPGDGLRVSCDARFFPLSPFLGSTPWLLGADPLASLRPVDGDDESLRAPRLETQAALGRRLALDEVPPRSVLNWPAYVQAMLHGEPERALGYLERFTNPEVTGETWEVYRDKYHGTRAIDPGPRRAAIRALSQQRAGERHPRMAA